jgi:hypothetical protein
LGVDRVRCLEDDEDDEATAGDGDDPEAGWGMGGSGGTPNDDDDGPAEEVAFDVDDNFFLLSLRRLLKLLVKLVLRRLSLAAETGVGETVGVGGVTVTAGSPFLLLGEEDGEDVPLELD